MGMKSLSNPENYHKTVIESSVAGIFVVDDSGRFEFGNDSFFNLSGWPREELIGQSFMKVIPEDLKDFMLLRWQEIQTGIEKPYETRIITKSGEIRNLFVSHSQTIIDGKRKYVIVTRDISEKKKYEISLQESEARYRDLFENADDPMYMIDAHGLFREINNAGCRMLEASKEEIIGVHISRWLTPESLESAKQRIKKHTSNEPIQEPVVYELICNNGTHKWAEIRTRPIKEGDRVTGIHGIARDITEKIKMEQKLKEYHYKLERSYEKLLEEDNVKTEFISNITHELLTPLTSIRGFVELLDDGTMGKINKEQKKSLEIILRNSDRLIKLIKELLDTSNMENNKLGLQYGLVSLNNILSKTTQDIHPQANDKQITIIKNIQQLPEIWGDEERLVQVITNLLINAIKFTPNNGKITIKAKVCKEQVKISISDTGIGIPADKLNSIFDKFYQVDGSAIRKYGGVGIGLSICKSIIDKHYGKIWAQSDGNGSTFYIVLPRLRYKDGERND